MDGYKRRESMRAWWEGKYTIEGRKIVRVEAIGADSFVYGYALLHLDNGHYEYAPQGPNQYRPVKSGVRVWDELEHVKRKPCNLLTKKGYCRCDCHCEFQEPDPDNKETTCKLRKQ